MEANEKAEKQGGQFKNRPFREKGFSPHYSAGVDEWDFADDDEDLG